jgi:hypothetical protein
MMEEILLDRQILDQIDSYDLDLTEYDWDEGVPVEELSYDPLELL